MPELQRTTLLDLQKKREVSEPITWLTGYDYPTAYFLDAAGIDMILVGDSLAMTMLGLDNTLPVSMNDMLRHTQAVRRGAPNAFVVGDMPYMSYQPSSELAVKNAGRFMAEAGCDAVKLEGGREMAERVSAITAAGIPTIGHLGLTPQSSSSLGGFRLQGKTSIHAKRIIEDARMLAEAGAFMVLLELVPDRVCELITERSDDCLIMSLGSGPSAHGQLLIFHDLFGLFPKFKPRMAKVYGDAGATIQRGVEQYIDEVRSGAFPESDNYFGMKEEEFQELLQLL